MEDLPNRIKNNLGITVEVNLLSDEDKHYIEKKRGLLLIEYLQLLY